MSKFFIQWASFFSLLVAATASAQTVHISHCLAGCPVVIDSNEHENSELIVRQLYVASINSQSGLADWQAYRVLADSVGVASLLPREWHEDALVSRATVQLEAVETLPQIEEDVPLDSEERSYQLGGINLLAENQGRLVPMSSFAGTPYWSELNFLSNMAALPFELRVGSWSRLDQAINALADEIGEVYVVSGPIYAGHTEEARERMDSEAGDLQPSAYFKVISTSESASAFIFDRDVQQHVSFCDQLSTLEQVESATGLALFPQRDDVITGTLSAQLTCTF